MDPYTIVLRYMPPYFTIGNDKYAASIRHLRTGKQA